MIYSKKVKVYKQGGTSITLPTAFCEMLHIQPGDTLNLTLDTDKVNINIEKDKTIEIFKIQKPLFGNLENGLIYNEDRSILIMRPFVELQSLFTEDEMKIYVKGFLNEKGILQILEKTEEQEW